MTKIAPSILAADFSRLAEDIKKVEKHADMLHIDVMDGHFVPNITFGPPVVECIRKITKLPLDAHLMIENPEKYAESFAKAGAGIISIHAEAANDLKGTLKLIKSSGAKPAVAVNPATPLSRIKDVLAEVDMVLLMTVNPGFGGQKFIESVVPKIQELKELREKNKLGFEIEVDGGINAKTAKMCTNAGADILVAGSYIYSSMDIAAAINSLRQA